MCCQCGRAEKYERQGAERAEAAAMTAVGKVKIPSPRSSPYMRSSRIQPAAHQTQALGTSAPISGARKAKAPCTSAPAVTGRTPAGGASVLIPKRGASNGSVRVPRERDSVPSIQKPPYALIPVRLKRTGLKLLDPEKVKSLKSASRLHVSGGAKQNPILHQTINNKQPPRSCKSTLPRSSVKLTTTSRKRTGIASRREINNTLGRVKIRQADDTRSRQLWHQMKHLLLLDDKSRESDKSQLQNVQPGDGKTSGQTVPNHAGNLEESNIQAHEKSSHPSDHQATSGQIDEAEDRRTLVSDPQTGDVQELGDYKEPQSSCHWEENHETKGSHNEGPPTHLSHPDNVVAGLLKQSPEAEPTTSSQENKSSGSQLIKTGTSGHKSQPVSPEGENVSIPENLANSQRCKTILGPNLPKDQQNASEMFSQELKGHLWSRTYDVIRQSQGVLVLTRSTDENAVFIPKLKLEFTPDNSIDWTRPDAPPPLGTNKGGAPIKNNLGVLNACTPRGPTFSKSMLKKSSMLYGQDIVPGVSSESDIPMIGACHLDRIVDLSISFQGKYEEQEIPADIPKILLTEEDYDED
ncbi:uncharacterized protein LOC143805229 isoform X2 [Ranitomeya variabilis]|uniref:uncharacterized protein LOC143805229 isoform X2 n=1 Tax=Ranitomeya variabilis TaxID=490064 RepID=UPI0040565BA3